MKNINKLSVITICYNIKDEIKRTCESIVNQSWQDFEWIVVDGGSTDGTLDILKEYKNRINVLISEPDNGIYNAMNKGIKKASGEWLNFMNGGDCFASNDVLEQVFKNKNYEADVLYGRQYFAKQNKYRNPPENISLEWLCSNTLGHQASFYKRELFYKFGFYDENFKISADHEKNICLKKIMLFLNTYQLTSLGLLKQEYHLMNKIWIFLLMNLIKYMRNIIHIRIL